MEDLQCFYAHIFQVMCEMIGVMQPRWYLLVAGNIRCRMKYVELGQYHLTFSVLP